MRYSIIIPVKSINDYVRETVPCIQGIPGDHWEVLILPNEPEPDEWGDPRVSVVPSGPVGPAEKRDQGAVIAGGEVLVFLDDDSYPSEDFLEVAEKYLGDPGTVGVAGPAVTPPSDSFWQRVSGAVFLSRLSGGAPERYVPVGDPRPVDDWPSVNLMFRRRAFLDVGGFNSSYWPGEDTKLCLDIIKATGKEIMYAPDMVVWHHRRSGLARHLKQVGAYGLHRGYFAKRYPETSRRLLYFLPSGLVLFLAAGVPILLLYPGSVYGSLFVAGVGVYAAGLSKAFADITRHEPVSVAAAALLFIFPTHLWYGVQFIRGLLTRNLVSKLR